MIKNLNVRERLIVGVGGAFVAFTILWLGVYGPAVERRELLARKIETKKRELAEVTALAEQYGALKQRFGQFAARVAAQPGGASILTRMESLAAAAGLKENMESMTPQPPVEMEGYRETPVALKFSGVSLPKLVAFLKETRAEKNNLRIKRISIKPQYENPALLDVSLSISGFESAQ